MKKLLILSIILLDLVSRNTLAQLPGKINVGIGAGLDYGGFGGHLSFFPADRIGLFGGLGYNLNALGYNVGAQLNFPNEKRVNFHISGMYGYNAVLIVKGNVTSKTTYYGPSVGTGLILKSKRSGKSFWRFEVIVPFRPDAYHNAIDDMKLIGYDVREPWPVAFSFGYHIKLL